MVLAIDYDQTFSDYPEQFTKVREMFQAIGATVYLVTARDEETERIDPKHNAILSGFDKIIYTSGKAKAGFVRADIFIDDSLSNVLKCQKSGLPALLFHTERTADFPMFKVFSLNKDEIIDSYLFMKKYA